VFPVKYKQHFYILIRANSGCHETGRPIRPNQQLDEDNFHGREKKNWSQLPGHTGRMTVGRKITLTSVTFMLNT
jgi:hypothetical protein